MPPDVMAANGTDRTAARGKAVGGRGGPDDNGVVPVELLVSVKHRLVRDLMAFIRSYVVMSPEQLLVVALWTIHTHCIDRFEQTPYLSVTSPEKQCGKSRLLDVLELVVARPWYQIIPSEAVLYRTIHLKTPTLLLDEVDTIFNPRSADRYEGHRALLNGGHRRGAKVGRCIGTSSKLAEFRVFCPKVLAGIGTLPDTIADRAVPIRLKRRQRNESVERFKRRKVEKLAKPLVGRIEQWVEQHADELDPDPDMPDEIDDRMQEGCESLVAIADVLGCADQIRSALVELLTAERLDDQESMRLRLLRDTRVVFKERGMPTNVRTTELLKALHAIAESPWSNYYGRSLDERDLADLLRPYEVKPQSIRLKVRQKANVGNKNVVKGYKRDHLHEAWERYLLSEDENEA
jgi:hypothetical protein